MSVIHLPRRTWHMLLLCLLMGGLLTGCVEFNCPSEGAAPGPCRTRPAVSGDKTTVEGNACAVGLPSKVCMYPGMGGCDTTQPNNKCKTTNSGPNTQCFCQCLPL